jgi:hypothetical protein
MFPFNNILHQHSRKSNNNTMMYNRDITNGAPYVIYLLEGDLMNRANADIRNAVATNGFKLWELAAALGINDGNLSRKLRTELPAAEREHILAVIAEMRSIQDGEVETNANR